VVDLRTESKHGETTILGDTVSVKVTPDRRVWVRWEGKQGRFSDTGRKINPGFSRSQKEVWLLQYRNLILERFAERGYGEKDVDALASRQKALDDERAQSHTESPVLAVGEEYPDDDDDDEDDVDDRAPPPPRPN